VEKAVVLYQRTPGSFTHLVRRAHLNKITKTFALSLTKGHKMLYYVTDGA